MNKKLQTILYVEDEPDIRRVVKFALEATAGMTVIACSSGVEAIELGARTAIDLVLLDVMMPQMDGPTTLTRLREIPAFAHTPVVFITAKAHPAEIAHFKSLGALDVIAKPFDPMALASTLREIWERVSTPPNSSSKNFTEPSPTRELSAEERFAERMVALTAQFQRELPERLLALQAQWRALSERWNHEALNALHTSTHNLAGAGSTFGYDELTARARAFDKHLKRLLEQQQAPDHLLWIEISALFAELEAELRRILPTH